MAVEVRPIGRAEHEAFVATQPSVSYLHTAQWASVREGANGRALGIWSDGELVGVGLVQYLHRFAGRKEGYFPDGPHVAWDRVEADEVLAALEAHLRADGCYLVRLGPFVTWQTWSNETLKELLAREEDADLRHVEADTTDAGLSRVVASLRQRGWHPAKEANTDDGQNGYNFFVDVARPAEEILAGMNQMYRRNIKKAQKAGATVRQGGAADLPTFHALYAASGEREGFFVLPLDYFETQFRAFGDDPDHVRVFLVELDGEPLAGAVWVKVGDHVWYTRGGSSDTHRDVRAVNLLQWAMIEAAHDAGAKVYDMGGIYPWINESSRGLLQFKVGTGGYGVASLNEWAKELQPVVAVAARTSLAVSRAARSVLHDGPGRARSLLAAAPRLVSRLVPGRRATSGPDRQEPASATEEVGPRA